MAGTREQKQEECGGRGAGRGRVEETRSQPRVAAGPPAVDVTRHGRAKSSPDRGAAPAGVTSRAQGEAVLSAEEFLLPGEGDVRFRLQGPVGKRRASDAPAAPV